MDPRNHLFRQQMFNVYRLGQSVNQSFLHLHLLDVLDKLSIVNQANGIIILNFKEANPEKKTEEPVNYH